MTVEEFSRLMGQLVERRVITLDEAQTLIAAYVAGDIGDGAMPVDPVTAIAPRQNEEGNDLLWLLLLLGIGVFPEDRLSYSQRTVARDRLRLQFEQAVEQAAAAAATGRIREWHEDMIEAISVHYRRQQMAGSGGWRSQEDQAEEARDMRLQLSWLFYFAADLAVHQALGAPRTVAYIINRMRLYAGAGWAAFFRSQERGSLAGWVVDYIARDDERTCGPCRNAEAEGPYLPGQGPMPGEVCQGLGACRCTRRRRYDMAAYRDLVGLPV